MTAIAKGLTIHESDDNVYFNVKFSRQTVLQKTKKHYVLKQYKLCELRFAKELQKLKP